MKLLEKDMEDLIIANPQKYLKESDLKLVSRQYSIGNYRFDLLFEDRHHGKLIVEIQRGTLDRNHTYKILDYFDEYKRRNPNNFIDLMIVANKITRERRDRLKSYGIDFFEIPESVFLDDPNLINKKETETKIDIATHDMTEQKNRFEQLLQQEYWKSECLKKAELTLHRKEQLVEIFKKYNGGKIPFSHFEQNKINDPKLRNSQIYPVICAFHIGYFNILGNSISLKNQFEKEFDIDTLTKGINKNIKSESTQQGIASSDGRTITDKIKSIFHNRKNKIYQRNEIIDMVTEAYPETNRSSIIPSDYCYNLINKGIPFSTHIFEALGSGTYKCLCENFPYEGKIYWKNKEVGYWDKGKPILNIDLRK